MLKIRLQRTGRKHEPTFRLVLTDSKNSTKSGKFKEILGSYDPRHKDQAVFKTDRITHWISQGAQPTDTVHNLLVAKEIIKGEKRNVLPKKSPVVKEEEEKPTEEAAPEGDAPAEEEKKEDSPDDNEPKEDSSAEVEQSETKEEAPEEEKPAEEPAKEEEKKEE